MRGITGLATGRALVAALLALCASAGADDAAGVCERRCRDGDEQGCHELAVRVREGQDPPPIRDRSAAFLLDRCRTAGSGQPCFTACLAGLEACWAMGDTSEYLWADMRAFVSERDLSRRQQMIAASRNLKFLFWLIRTKYNEVSSLPEFPELSDRVRARVQEIALTDPDPGLRAWAIKDGRMEYHPATLKEIAQKDPYLMVREAAKKRLGADLNPWVDSDDAAEAVRMTKSSDLDTRLMGARKVRDVNVLIKLAEKDRDADVREAAVVRLAEFADQAQAVLARIAENDKEEGVRGEAAALVTDPKLLERLLRSRHAGVRRHALENLEGKSVDPSVLLRVVEGDGDEELREEATRRLTDQGTLARLATSSGSAGVRAMAASKLTDQRLLGEIASRDGNPAVYGTALRGIKDQAILAEVVRRRPDERILEQAAREATDQAILARIATTAKEWLTRSIAVVRLEDRRVLEQIAANDAVPMVQEAAQKRLVDLGAGGAR